MTIFAKLRARPRRSAATAAAAALVVGLSGGAGVALSTIGTPTVAAAATACGSKTAAVHYEVVATSIPVEIYAIALSGLATGCDGHTAKVVLKGNTAGQPATTTKGGKTTPTLSTATSAVTPCGGSKLSTPVKVKTGSITLDLCKASTSTSPGPFVSVHDLTQLTLIVATAAVSPGGVVFTTGHPSTSIQGATTGALAFTGADIAAMAGAGVLLLALGGLLVLWDRRRRRRPAGEEV